MADKPTFMTCEACGTSDLTAYYRCKQCGAGALSAGNGVEWTMNPVPHDPETWGVPMRARCPGCDAETSAHALVCNKCDWAKTY